jgi:hypothetical protein
MPIPGPPIPTLGTPAVVRGTATVSHDGFEPVAGVLACILPGLGHWFLGERWRAAAIAAGVLGLFFGGMLIGGIDAVDSQEDTIWFVGQAMVGPVAFGVDYAHQHHFKVRDGGKLRTANPGETRDAQGNAAPALNGELPPNSKSLGRMNELGTLFSTIAGMLNLIVIIDAWLFSRHVPVRKLGLQASLADAESPLGAPQSIEASLKSGFKGGLKSGEGA